MQVICSRISPATAWTTRVTARIRRSSLASSAPWLVRASQPGSQPSRYATARSPTGRDSAPQSRLWIRNKPFESLFRDLLEAYNFTVREDTPLSQEVAVDPEMLGKIFESIVLHAESAGQEFQAPDKRKATGSYYTPRIVVHFICRETLRLYFAGRAQLLADSTAQDTWPARISRLFKEIEPDDGFNEGELKILREILAPTEAKRCLETLNSLRTLDPAVGSGAFP